MSPIEKISIKIAHILAANLKQIADLERVKKSARETQEIAAYLVGDQSAEIAKTNKARNRAKLEALLGGK